MVVTRNSQPIGVFDSGVGGLSIFIELKRLMPKENFIFLADQEFVPYGEKSKKELVKRCLKITDYFVKKHNVKMIVVACNTATCNAINEMRGKHNIPIVGTVPAVKLAAEMSKTGVISVISTPSTSKSTVLKKLIKDYCGDVDVLNIGCPHLEDVVEHGELSGLKARNLLTKYLKDIKNSKKYSKTDKLVLGCTHYPFLAKTIQKIVGPKIELVDSGEPIARHAMELLKEHSMRNAGARSKSIYFTTGNPLKFGRVAGMLLKLQIKAKKVAF